MACTPATTARSRTSGTPRLATFEERRDRQQLRCRDDPLATASVNANLEHVVTVAEPNRRDIRAGAGLVSGLIRMRCALCVAIPIAR